MAFSSKKSKSGFFQQNEGPSNPFIIKEGRFGQLKDPAYHTGWTEHSFIVDDSGRETVGLTFNLNQIILIRFVIFLFLAIIIGRASWLQIFKGGYYYSLAEGNRLRIEAIEPKRGIIYDRNLKPLVQNEANFVLYLIPHDLPAADEERDQILRKIVAILDGQKTESIGQGGDQLTLIPDSQRFYNIKNQLGGIKRTALKAYQPLFVADNINYEKAMALYLECDYWPGVFLTNKIRRQYLISSIDNSASLAHILGYTGKINQEELEKYKNEYSPIDYLGKAGIESVWEKDLKGRAGQKDIEVDALGRMKKILNETAAQDGSNLRLSLDYGLQQEIELVARNHMTNAGLAKASVVAIDPRSGEILALVSLPAYDNNLFAKGISAEQYQKFLEDPNRPLFNSVISGEFPSGSTVKLVVASAALEAGVIDETTSFLSTGGLRIGQWFFPDWKAGGHGNTDVRKALAESVNTFFYYVGGGYQNFNGLGLDRLVKYFKLFGLGEKTGIDLNGERSGFVPTAAWKKAVKSEPWYIGDTYHLSIGQGDLLVTPLQVANYTAAVANGGTLYRPHLVKEILSENNQIQRIVQPEIINSGMIKPENIEIVRSGMRQTITDGSGRSLNTLPVQVAGKTGTAQWNTKKAPHAWFTGFAPYDKPEIVLTVLIEEGREGSIIATQIAKEVFSWYFGGRNSANQSFTATTTASSSILIKP